LLISPSNLFSSIFTYIPTNDRPANPETHSVVVTGNFDDWSQSQGVLTKDAEFDAFEVLLRVPERQKLVFKFVVNDSEWTTHDSYKLEHDEHGNSNNYVDADELIEVEEFTKEATPSPVATAAETSAAKTTPVTEAPAATVSQTSETVESVKTPVETAFPAEKHANLVLESREGDEKLTNVLTSDLSYAAVSVPESEGSAFENISRDEENDFDASNRSARNRNAPEDITPTNSNSGATAAAKQGGSGTTQDSEVTTLGPNSRNSSFTGRPHQPDSETVDILKVPGSFPLPVKSTEKRPSRRDGLITRLKGMFRS